MNNHRWTIGSSRARARDADVSAKSNVRQTVIVLLLFIGGLLTVFGAVVPLPEKYSILLITFGVTFAASAIVSFVMLSAGLMDLAENAKDLAAIIGSRLGMPCAERFTLVKSAAEVGVSRAYLSRMEALREENFHAELERETDQLFFVGSSLLGLLQDRRFEHVIRTLKVRLAQNVELKFMLTHPGFADFRAAQEGRNPGEIGGEVVRSLRILLRAFGDSDLVAVYLYRGTPTCFGILASEAMLLNPYPYGRQAYESPCFEIRGQTPAYNAYRQAHFQAQFAGKIERFKLSEEAIRELENKAKEYSERVAKFEEAFQEAVKGGV